MLPLPLLPPAWLIAEADSDTPRAADAFIAGLRKRHWIVTEELPTTNPSSPPADLICLSLTTGILRDSVEFSDILHEVANAGTPLLLKGTTRRLYEFVASAGVEPLVLLPHQVPGWWGPERMDEDLIRNTPALPVTRVTAGERWAMVETEDSVGLAAMPALAGGGTKTAESFEYDGLLGAPLTRLASGLRHPAGVARSLACAAVNAGIATPRRAIASDGLLPAQRTAKGRTVVVGRFPKLAEKRPGAIVLEKDPGADDLPADVAPYVIPGAEDLVITASAWSNGTLAGLLRLAARSRVTLVGPGTPMTDALGPYGVHRMAGFIVEDRERTRSVIAEGGGVSAFKSLGRQVMLAPD